MDLKKNKPIYKAVLSAGLVFFLLIFTSEIAGVLLRNPAFAKRLPMFWNEQLYCRVNFVYAVLAYFSFCEMLVLSDNYLCEAFYELKPRTLSFVKRCAFVFRRFDFWFEYVIIAFALLVFPSLAPFSDFADGFFPKVRSVYSLIPLLLAILFVVRYIAYIVALGYWSCKSKIKLMSEKSGTTASFKTLLRYALVTVMWVLGGLAMSIVYPMIATIGAILKVGAYVFLIIAAVGIITFVLQKYIRAFLKRRKLLISIKTICKENGYPLSILGHPYFALFFKGKDCGLIIKMPERTLAVKLISVVTRSDSIYIGEDGFITYMSQGLLINHSHSIMYTFECEEDAKKILLACPVPKHVYARDEHMDLEIDFGFSVLEYDFYNSSGFINALKHDCF